MEIKVFGSGCAGCSQAEQMVKDVLAAKGITASVIKVSDIKEIMMAGIMSTPGIAIDGVLKSTGKIPSKEEIASWLDEATASVSTSTPTSPTGSGGCCGYGSKC